MRNTEANNFVRFICEDCIQYIRNVDLVLGEIQGVRVSKQNLKDYKREFESLLGQNKSEIKQLLEATEKRYIEGLKSVCWLIRRKANDRAPGQTSTQNTKSISSAISSQQISGKNSESKLKLP